MSIMLSNTYDAFIEAEASAESAKKATEEVANFDARLMT